MKFTAIALAALVLSGAADAQPRDPYDYDPYEAERRAYPHPQYGPGYRRQERRRGYSGCRYPARLTQCYQSGMSPDACRRIYCVDEDE